ncbi:uncharacterized protein LOC124207863 [Daphnia pulex]|uniref:uncharacterized protein LOC124207863 n=1 Tax=Daphnia pulex TaxID=6669 RepID=UPI001EDC95B8|nr:uncharacterized protein LOC124207863 [Daphnia pulex]XP_046634310.1 uncharacterized protein LOC124313431 [Daphnia pulicaria]
MTRRVKTRCCGLSLQVGTKIIAFFSMIGYLIQLVIGMIQSSNLNLNDDLLNPVEAFVIISTVIVSSALIACCVLLLHVAFSNSRSILLVPWLVGDMLMRSIHTIILISGFIMAFTANVSHGVSTVFIMSCFIGLETYLWWIVLCYYRELSHHESNCRGATTSELVSM